MSIEVMCEFDACGAGPSSFLNESVVPLFTKGSGVGLASVPSNDLNYSNITNLSIGAGVPNVTVQQLAVNATTYYHADHLGTAQMEFAGGGWPVWTGDFAPYGQEINPQQTANNYKFTGLERDAEGNLNLDHAQFRQYSSQTGRWMSPDPYGGSMDLANPQSLNRYAYVGNMPLGFTDPSGLLACGNCNIDKGGGTTIGDIGSVIATAGVEYLIGKIFSLFDHPQCSSCSHSRPNGGLWDEHGSYKPKPYTGVADILGIAQAGCEFGACGGGFTQDGQWAGQAGRGRLQYGAASLFELLGFSVAYADLNDPNKRLYGTHYCGPGGGGAETGQVDHFCHLHDICYANAGITAGIQLGGGTDAQLNAMGSCNQHLCDALSGLSTPYGSQEREAQYGVLGYFRTISRRRCH